MSTEILKYLAIGAILFEAAAQSALLTIEINLSALQNAALRSSYERQISNDIQEIERLKAATLRKARHRMTAS